jgi:hypothetical protein
MTPEEREILIEAVVTAHRERDESGRILPSAEWMDLAPNDRALAFALQSASRRLEAGYHSEGLNSTMRAVIARARRLPQL